MSLMTVPKPSTREAVDRESMAVSSLPATFGTGVSRSPSTSSCIRFAQAFMGLLMLPASTRATAMDISTAATITTMLMAMPL